MGIHPNRQLCSSRTIQTFSMHTFLFVAALIALSAVRVLADDCSIFYLASKSGHVYEVDSTTGTYQAKSHGAVEGVGQIIGAAYDPDTGILYMNDRSGGKLLAWDSKDTNPPYVASTNSALQNFQGGAILDGKLYGIHENQQKILAYIDLNNNFALVPVAGAALPTHVHSLGRSPTGSAKPFVFLSSGTPQKVYLIGTDGVVGDALTTLSSSMGFAEDMDSKPLGSYLAMKYSTSLTSSVYSITASGGHSAISIVASPAGAFSSWNGQLGGIACRLSAAAPVPTPCDCTVYEAEPAYGETKHVSSDDLDECCDGKSLCLSFTA